MATTRRLPRLLRVLRDCLSCVITFHCVDVGGNYDFITFRISTSAGMFLLAIVQALILLALAPLFSGISRMIRARIQSRRGPGLLQDYRDIAK